jgi:CRISPR-associated endonuclease Csn1
MKKILGLDLGTNSIGWALVEISHQDGIVKIMGLGSRILPMDAGEIGDFEASGKIKSAAAARTEKRGPRRLNERYLLRRDRLHLVLNLLDALPRHYKLEIDFTNEKGKKCGQFKANKEPKIAYLSKKYGQKAEFLFMDSYDEMLKDINDAGIRNEKGKRIPYDWTLYYLRQKALSKEITLEELAWVLLSYNQKRGYEKLDVEDKSAKDNEIIEELDLAVKEVNPKIDKEGHDVFEIQLEGNDSFIYSEDSHKQMSFKGDIKEVLKISQVNETGETDVKKTKFTITDIYELEIENVQYEKTNYKNPHKYSFHFTNGWIHSTEKKNYTSQFNKVKGRVFDYIVTSVFDYQGNFKERSFKTPDYSSETSKDWTLLKKKTEKEALKFNSDHGYKDEEGNTKNYISPKIYSILKNDARVGYRTKIIGGMFQVVERKFYREELKQIIATQREFHNSLKDSALFEKCVRTLYPKNESHAKNLLGNKDTIEHLLVEDILLYQRPLKTKKSEIADCKYEIRHWKELRDKKTGNPIEVVDKETGEITISKEAVYHKAVSASHPYFQEFRIWDKLHNLRLMQLECETDGKLSTNVDMTGKYFDMEAYQALFFKMNNQKSLDRKQFLSFCKSRFKIKDIENYVWNFPED